MSWNNYDSNEVLSVVGRHGSSAGNGDMSATMTGVPRTPPPAAGNSPGGATGVVSPDRSTTPLERGFAVSPMNSLDRGGVGRGRGSVERSVSKI